MALTSWITTWPARLGWGGLGFVALALAALVLPALGRWFWWADLFSHFVPHYAVLALGLTIALAVCRRRVLAACALAIFIVEIARLVPLWAPLTAEARATDAARLTIVQFNVRIKHRDPQRVIEWITSQDPDVAVLLEVTRGWVAPLKALNERFPVRMLKLHPNGSGIVVLSRVPSSSLHLEYVGDRWRPTVVLTASPLPGRPPIVFYATHLTSPTTRLDAAARNRQALALARRLRADPLHEKIVVGDLNMTRWSPWFPVLTEAGLRDADEGFGLQATWPRLPFGRWLGVAIDHVLVSPTIHVIERRVGPDLGSDHRPVVTTIGWS